MIQMEHIFNVSSQFLCDRSHYGFYLGKNLLLLKLFPNMLWFSILRPWSKTFVMKYLSKLAKWSVKFRKLCKYIKLSFTSVKSISEGKSR